LTGATGFLGSHTAEVLAAAGYRVTCLVRKTSNLRWLNSVDVELVHGDVTDLGPAALEQGGRDVLDAIEASIPGHPLDASRRVLREHGNMSSPSVLFALDDALREGPPPEPGADWWLVSFGAGFAAHSCRVRRG
jgi:NAD(P)-dependent dehydrogenase (short-subunit alcohol dehydrogenase family)